MGMRSDGDVILDAMYIDKARMRNRLCFDLWNTVDHLPYNDDPDDNLNGTEGTFVEVLVNGEYNGLYCLTDKIDRKKLQLNKYKVDPASGEIAQHGMLYKATDWTGATQFNGYDTSASTQALNWFGWEQKYPDESNAFANWTPMINLIEYAAPDLYPNKTLFSALLERRFYVQNLVNYVLFLGETGAETNQAPCLSLVQFQIDGGQLVLSAYQRSSDASLGLPADIYHLYLMARQIDLPLHSITLNLGNVHIYENNLAATRALLDGQPAKFELNV